MIRSVAGPANDLAFSGLVSSVSEDQVRCNGGLDVVGMTSLETLKKLHA